MNLSQLSIAYSPENEVLEDVVRSSVAMMLTRNIADLFPLVAEMFPDLVANIPPELISVEVAYGLLKAAVRVEGYNSSADLRSIYYDEQETRRVIAAVQFPDYLSGWFSDHLPYLRVKSASAILCLGVLAITLPPLSVCLSVRLSDL